MSFRLHVFFLFRYSSKKCFFVALWTYKNQIAKHFNRSNFLSPCFYKTSQAKYFARKPRPLLEAKMWKATEFRQFLLYTGPVVLLDKLKSALYQNFLLLSVCMRLLAPDVYSLDNKYKQELIFTFVQNFTRLY